MLATLVVGRGQAVPPWIGLEDLPEPPAFGVLDEAGFYSRDPEGLRRISDLLRELEKRRGFKIYLVIETVLDSNIDPLERAPKLYRAWIPHGDGLVIVYQKDTGMMGIGWDLGLLDSTDEEESHRRRIPSYEMKKILLKVSEKIDRSTAPEVLLENYVADLVNEFESYFQSMEQSPPKERTFRLWLMAVGGISVLGLGALGLAWLVRRMGIDAPQTFQFPEMEVRERLGAPYGGGMVSSRRFGDGGGAGGDPPR